LENLKSPLIINLLILFSYSLLIRLEVMVVEHAEYNNLSIAIYSMIFIAFQVIVNLVLALKIFSADPEKKKAGKEYLLCTFIILLIGLPTCFLNAKLW
jgi:hypothetical protein